MQLYIVRHGETDYNKKKIVQGRGVNSSLNELGQAQAAALFQHYQSTNFAQIYASSLNRSLETVERFNKLNYEVKQFEALDEISWGEQEGMKPTPALHKEYLKMKESWAIGEYGVKIPGGESILDVSNRLVPFVDHVEQQHESPILICSHGRTIAILLCLLLKQPFTEMSRFRSHNTGLHILEKNKEGLFMIQQQNNISHLELLINY